MTCKERLLETPATEVISDIVLAVYNSLLEVTNNDEMSLRTTGMKAVQGKLTSERKILKSVPIAHKTVSKVWKLTPKAARLALTLQMEAAKM